MNRYCFQTRYKKGYWNCFKKAVQPQPGGRGKRRRSNKPRSIKKSRNKTSGISQDRFSVERLLKHSGLFGLAAITYRSNVRASQIEFHIFTSLLTSATTNNNNKRTDPIIHQYGGETWGKVFVLGSLCCYRGLDGITTGSQRIVRHALQRELHDESSFPRWRRVPMHVRLGKGRLRKHTLSKRSGHIVRRKAGQVRDLRWGIAVLQLQPMHRMFIKNVRMFPRSTLHLVKIYFSSKKKNYFEKKIKNVSYKIDSPIFRQKASGK